MKRIPLIAIAIAFLNVAQARPLSQNDISILLPLPTQLPAQTLFKPSDQGGYGELIPIRFSYKLPPLDAENADQTFANLRVVAIRIDPCFEAAPPKTGCLRQIRFIWQPIVKNEAGLIVASDAAVHTFYDLSRWEFSRLIKKLKMLKDSREEIRNEILSVHPTLQKQGMNGAYATALKKIILAEVGVERLSRIAFMQLENGGIKWVFGGFDIDSNQSAKAMIIPRVRVALQDFSNITTSTQSPNGFIGGITPAPKGRDQFSSIVQGSTLANEMSEDDVKAAYQATQRIENPKVHSANTVDCVSCHLAQPARLWMDRNFQKYQLGATLKAFQFTSLFSVKNSSANPSKTTLLRAFGYDENRPAISQRTVNETARALEVLQESF